MISPIEKTLLFGFSLSFFLFKKMFLMFYFPFFDVSLPVVFNKLTGHLLFYRSAFFSLLLFLFS